MMGIEMTEEETRLKELYVQTRADLFDVLRQLLEAPDDVSFLPRIVAALTLNNRRNDEQKAYYEANGQRREQIKQSRIEETLRRQEVNRLSGKLNPAQSMVGKKERVEALAKAREINREKQAAAEQLKKQEREGTREARIEAEVQKTKADAANLKAVKKTAAAARADLLRAQIESDKIERLALQGRKQAIVQIALATGDLQAITEDRIQEVVNSQRRSNGGVIRIESGAGK